MRMLSAPDAEDKSTRSANPEYHRGSVTLMLAA